MSRQKLSAEDWLSAGEALRERLKTGRLARGLSQERLAQKAGLSLPALRKIERGATAEPGIFTVLAILRELGMSVRVLEELAADSSQQQLPVDEVAKNEAEQNSATAARGNDPFPPQDKK
ncbi:helix-turn-helix domain-containing protein [Williamsia sp. R60]